MNLQQRLDAQRRQFQKMAPKEALDIMHRATENLRQSGILNNMLKVGDPAPEFELNNAYGKPVRVKNLLGNGPLVVNFYRGKW